MMLETVIWPCEGPGSLQFNYIQCMVSTTTVDCEGSTGENVANSNSRDQSLTDSPTDYTSEPSLPHPHHDQPLNEAVYTTTNETTTNETTTNETTTNGSATNDTTTNETTTNDTTTNETTTNGSATAATQDMGHLVLQGQAYRMTINMAYGSLPLATT